MTHLRKINMSNASYPKGRIFVLLALGMGFLTGCGRSDKAESQAMSAPRGVSGANPSTAQGPPGGEVKKPPTLDAPIEYLWPRRAPGALGEEEQDRPSLSVYPPLAEKANGAAVIICPGGGYAFLSVEREGQQVAQWLNRLGVTAFVLQYRIAPRYHHPSPMWDIQRAIRLVRAGAARWKLDPSRIGVLGFSAGGHLASTAMTRFDEGKANATDPVDRVHCRPDFGVLVYPVIVFGKPYTHERSMKRLLDDRVNEPQLVEEISTERHVTAQTPPCFLIHTGEDAVVPADNSVDFYLALRKAGVPAELHIYEKGDHGFGLGGTDPVLSTWPKLLASWMRGRGLLAKKRSPGQ
jgi:acetyl esterase/lipase